jgi:septation ring formation regulator EzrA
MSKRKSKKRVCETISADLQEKIRHIRDHLTPFQNETSSVKQSWFDDLVEWYAKVLFQNIREAGERVESVRRAFWLVGDGPVSNKDVYRRLADRALHLFEQLSELHASLDHNRKTFERIRSISHDLSDGIEVINSDLDRLAKDLRSQLIVDEKSSSV